MRLPPPPPNSTPDVNAFGPLPTIFSLPGNLSKGWVDTHLSEANEVHAEVGMHACSSAPDLGATALEVAAGEALSKLVNPPKETSPLVEHLPGRIFRLQSLPLCRSTNHSRSR
jgi:hypothetical protein